MIDFTHGFLPTPDPLIHLPEECAEWEAFGRELSKLSLTDYLRPKLKALPPFPVEALTTEGERWRAASLFAYMTSHYVLGRVGVGNYASEIPAVLAVPFYDVSQQLGVPPILSYAFQTMFNWRRIDPTQPVQVGNLTLMQNFLGGLDEEWFVTLHTEIEAVAGDALRVLEPAQACVANDAPQSLAGHLATVGDTLQRMTEVLGRMPDHCDPYIYYHRVRPFMFGWKDNPDMPNGMVYEGVDAYGGRPMKFRGETGAQSGVIPAIDAALGVVHERDEMRVYLAEMREYMPPRDREFVASLEAGPSVRDYVQAASQPDLTECYNYALEKLAEFRGLHIRFAAEYILKPAQTTEAVGTGGTPFTYYLKKHIKETEDHILS